MHPWLVRLSQLAVMAAIVATLVFLPLGFAVVGVLRLFGVAFDAVVTFNGSVHAALGLVAWWLLAFAGAWGYTACMYPWEDDGLPWQGREKGEQK